MKYFQIRSKLELWLYLTICISCIRWTNSIKFKPSPCPGKFNYESTTNDDRWYGDITFPVNATIEGSTIRIELDRPSQLLVTTAGPITTKDNQVYFITHDNIVLEKGSTYKLIFMVKFDKENVIPMLETIHFNGQRICPPDLVTLALGGGNDYSTPRPDIKATAPTDVLSDIDKKPKNPTRATTQTPYNNNNNGGNIDYYTESSNANRLTTSRTPNSNNFGGGNTGNQGNNGYNPGNSNNFGGGNNGNQGNSGYPDNSNFGGGNNGNQGGNGYNPGNLDNFGTGNNGNQGNNGYNPGNSNNFNGNSNAGNQGSNSYNPSTSDNYGGGSNNNQGSNGYNPNTSNNFGSNGNNQGNNGYGSGNSNNFGNGGTSGNNGFNSGNQDTFSGGSSDFGPNSNSNSNQQNGFNSGNQNTLGTNGNVNQGNNGFNNFGGNGNSNQGNSGISGGSQGSRNPNQGGDVIFNNGGGSNNGFTQRPNIGNEATVSGQVACGSVSVANPLITLAQNSEHGQWPWHVALFMRDEVNPSKSSYICGGSLVSKNRVITAAHCVSLAGNRIVNPNSLTAYMGKYNINTDESTSQKRTISSFKVNPEYNKANFHNDIAILNLNEDVDYTNYVRPVCLWEAAEGISDVVGQNGYVVGWGYNEYEQLNTELKQATMPIVSTEKCARSDPQFFSEYVSENAFCAGSLNGTGPCKGDSGGGLVVKRNNYWYLRGIVSVSAAPKKGSVCNNHQYIVFTDTAKYNDFIKRNI